MEGQRGDGLWCTKFQEQHREPWKQALGSILFPEARSHRISTESGRWVMGWLTSRYPGCLRHLISGLSVRSLFHITDQANPNPHEYFTSCPHLRVTVHQHCQQGLCQVCVGSGEGGWEPLAQMLCWSGNSRPEQGTLLFLIFLITAILIGMISFDLQFWFKFSKWLVLLSTFSCACQSPVSLLWKNFYSGHLPILNRASHLFRRLSFMRYVYVFNISPRWLYHLQTSAIQ